MANRRVKDFMIGTLVGGTVGAVTALLFAPKPGRELRADIAEGYHTVSDKTAEIARSVGTHTSDLFAKAKQVAGQVVEGVRSIRNEDEDQDEESVQAVTASVEQSEKEEEELVLIGSK